MSREGWPWYIMQSHDPARCSQSPTTLLVSPGLQAVVMSSSPRAMCTAQAHRHGLQSSQALPPPRWLCSAFFSSEPLAPFLAWRSAENPFCSPGSQGSLATATAWGTAGTSVQEGHRSPVQVPGRGQAVQGQRGKERRQCRRRRPGVAACKHDSHERGGPW